MVFVFSSSLPHHGPAKALRLRISALLRSDFRLSTVYYNYIANMSAREVTLPHLEVIKVA